MKQSRGTVFLKASFNEMPISAQQQGITLRRQHLKWLITNALNLDKTPVLEPKTVHAQHGVGTVCWMNEMDQETGKSWFCPLFLGCLQAFAFTVLSIWNNVFPRALPNVFSLRGLLREPKGNGPLAHPFCLAVLSFSHLSPSATLCSWFWNFSSREQRVWFVCFCISTQNRIWMNESCRILVSLFFLFCEVMGWKEKY